MDIFNLILNEYMAWISTIIGLFLSFKYVLRKSIKIDSPYKSILLKINKYAKDTHIQLGIFMILAALIHGIYSSEPILSLNMGTFCFIISILLGLTWYLRKNFVKPGIWIKHHRTLTLFFLLTLFIHFIDVNLNEFLRNNFTQNNSLSINNEFEEVTIEGDFSKYTFKDGIYEGVANGFGPNLTVEVTIKNSTVTNILVISHNERNERYFGPPISIIPNEIINNQSTNIDVISGATYTSKGIIEATKNALIKAF